MSTGAKRQRPPTGPLTTEETTEADELRQETLVKDIEPIERENLEWRDLSDLLV